MQFKKLIPEAENGKHWKPTEVGEWIQGRVKEYITDGFGNKQILLSRGFDEYGDEILTTIPTHKGLMRYYSLIKIGDYIKVTLIDILPPYADGYAPSYKYDVEIAPEEEEHKGD